DRRALGRGPSLPGRHRPVGDRPGARHRPTLRPGDDRRGHERHPVRVLRRRERLGRAGEDAEGARTRRRTGPGEIRAESGRVTMTEGDRTERRILIVGHRGAMAHAPENSLESYALAEEIGGDEIGLDVRLSADEELFLLHDANLDPTAGDGAARDLRRSAAPWVRPVRSAWSRSPWRRRSGSARSSWLCGSAPTRSCASCTMRPSTAPPVTAPPVIAGRPRTSRSRSSVRWCWTRGAAW